MSNRSFVPNSLWLWAPLTILAITVGAVFPLEFGHRALDESQTTTVTEVGLVSVVSGDLVVTSPGQGDGVVITEVYSPDRLAGEGVELVGDESLSQGVLVQTTTNCHPSNPFLEILANIRVDCGATSHQIRLPTLLLEHYLDTQSPLAEVGS